jgi:hypothetical protein
MTYSTRVRPIMAVPHGGIKMCHNCIAFPSIYCKVSVRRMVSTWLSLLVVGMRICIISLDLDHERHVRFRQCKLQLQQQLLHCDVQSTVALLHVDPSENKHAPSREGSSDNSCYAVLRLPDSVCPDGQSIAGNCQSSCLNQQGWSAYPTWCALWQPRILPASTNA